MTTVYSPSRRSKGNRMKPFKSLLLGSVAAVAAAAGAQAVDLQTGTTDSFLFGSVPAAYAQFAPAGGTLRARVDAIPGVAFGDEAKGFLRISFCNTEERMAEGVRRMKEALSI